MAVAPLFVADRATLLSKLRLSGASDADAAAVIDEAIQKVRIGFYDSLGASRVTDLLAIAFLENPTTADQVLRAKANSTEVLWVKMHLLRDLPVLFMDSSGTIEQTWNEEGLTRTDPRRIQTMIRELDAQIQDALRDLESGTPDPGTLQISVIEPDETPPIPGASIAPTFYRRSRSCLGL